MCRAKESKKKNPKQQDSVSLKVAVMGHKPNGFEQNFTVSLELSDHKEQFVDMWIMKKNGCLFLTLYQKETDRNTLLLATRLHVER